MMLSAREAAVMEKAYRDHVIRGANLLDTKNPRWYEKISIPMFDLESTLFCVLGQVYGDYTTGAREIFALPRVVCEPNDPNSIKHFTKMDNSCRMHGFCVKSDDAHNYGEYLHRTDPVENDFPSQRPLWDICQDQWLIEIEKRKEGANG